ncbi:small ribosomal subunit protein uS10m [Periplaneta americana]|uniref:small ribosomal subunit protein uS10m n=1 Tax=Periplaneta americana TaxID=6978 RepID=UPI0037E8F9A8
MFNMNIIHNITKLACRADSQALVRASCLSRHQPQAFVMKRMFSSSASLTKPEESGDLDKLYRMVEVEIRGNDPAVLKSYSWFTTTAARELGITVGECWTPRKANHDRLTLLKSVHIYKKHRVQYEIRTYFRFMQFLRLTGSTADTFLEYIQRNLPEGVAMKVTKVEIKSMPQHISVPSESNKQLKSIETEAVQ